MAVLPLQRTGRSVRQYFGQPCFVELSILARSTTPDRASTERISDRLAGRLRDGVITVTADTQRSQYLNRQAARRRLADLLSGAVAPPPRKRRATKPSRSSVERRLNNKRRRSQLKQTRKARPDD